jgi:catechol 2,3-dioxygenase-like lactoylglutathione lyase family enzyme
MVGVALTKDSIDLGIVVSDGEKALAFYRDTLGFEHVGDMPMGGGSTMHRLMCGTSLIKVISGSNPPAKAAPGGIQGAFGYRYWTISVSNINEVVEACEKGGYKVAVGVREFRPGVTIAIVEDPDGNWVELLRTS